jgi:hypothetical protein
MGLEHASFGTMPQLDFETRMCRGGIEVAHWVTFVTLARLAVWNEDIRSRDRVQIALRAGCLLSVVQFNSSIQVSRCSAMKIARIILFVSLVAALASGSSLANDKAKSKNPRGDGAAPSEFRAQPAAENESARSEPWLKVEVSITPHEKRVIQSYVDNCSNGGKARKKQKALPPGLAKKAARGGQLPPGWQRKCAKGQVMPEEVYKQCSPLPPEVIATLPPSPPGTILVAVSGKIVRLLQATREILDVFDVRL